MSMMRNFVPLLLLVMVAACGQTAWQKTYAASATLKEVTTSVHKNGWSEPLREQVAKCESALNPEVNTKADFDECLGPFVENPQVVKAWEAYNTAATALSAALIATENAPNSPDTKTKLRDSAEEAMDAALQLAALLPDGDKYVGKIQGLVNIR